MPNRQEFVEAARARDVPREAVDEILRCLRPCVIVNRDGKGEPVGGWHGKDETAIVLDCTALPTCACNSADHCSVCRRTPRNSP
ncbi:hypothetical protein [Streptomyces sp. NPDC003247]|uniref:hypothetical protein n=1 Tax=Streptomyces sp. NPDC003247 TaxID=3364677 RepID=UPI003697F394